MLAVAGYLGLLFLLGWLLLERLDPRLGLLERAGLSFGLGAGVFTFCVFLLALGGVPITLLSGAATLGIALLLVGFLAHRQNQGRWRPAFRLTIPELSALELFLLAAITGTLGLTFLVAAYWPPHAYDSLAIWVLKAKLLAAQGTLASQAAASAEFYPINIPLQLTFLHLLGEPTTQILFPLYLASLVVVFYANLRALATRPIALASCLFLSVTPYWMTESTIAYANVPFAYFYVASAIYLFRYLRERIPTYLLLSSLMVGLASWTRPEGLMYVAINMVVLVIWTPAWRRIVPAALLYTLGYVVFRAPWDMYIRMSHMTDYKGSATEGVRELLVGQFDLVRLSGILAHFWRQATPGDNYWGFLWLALPVAWVIGWRRWRERAALLMLIALNWVGLIYTYYSAVGAGPSSLDWWLYTGFDRMALHWSPLIVFYLGLALSAVNFADSAVLSLHARVNPYLALVVILTLPALIPLLRSGSIWGTLDGRRAIYLLYEFDRVIQDGIYYPRWLPDLAFGFGSPYFILHGPAAYYLGELFHWAGLDLVMATRLVFASTMILSGASMFGLVHRLTRSGRAGFLSGLLYVYARFMILDIMTRAGVEEAFALALLPLVFWALYETVLQPRPARIVVAALALSALILAQGKMALLVAPGLVLWVAVCGWQRSRNPLPKSRRCSLVAVPRLCAPGLAALLLGIGLAAIYVLPAVWEAGYLRPEAFSSDPLRWVDDWAALAPGVDPLGALRVRFSGQSEWARWMPGVVVVCLIGMGILIVARKVKMESAFGQWALARVVGLAGGAALGMWIWALGWQNLPVSLEEWVWTLIVLGTAPFAVLGGVTLQRIEARWDRGYRAAPTVAAGVLLVLVCLPSVMTRRDVDDAELPINTAGLMAYEQSTHDFATSTIWSSADVCGSDVADVWLAGKQVKTRIVTTDYADDTLWVGVLPGGIGLRTDGERLVLHVARNDLPVRINTPYFPGWKAYRVSPGTRNILAELPPLTPVGERGLLQLRMPAGREQWVLLRFEDSCVRRAAALGTIGCIVFTLVLVAWDVWPRKRHTTDRMLA